MAEFNCRVSGIILNDKNEILIIKRNKDYIPDSKEHIGWEICGGGIEHGETPEDALIREYKEETSINIIVNKLINVRTGFRNDKPLLVVLYDGKYVSGEVTLTSEYVDYKWVSVSEINNYEFGIHTSKDISKFIEIFEI